MPDRHQKIAKRAYEIWEQGILPNGSETDHWIEAERQINAELLSGLSLEAVKVAKPKKSAKSDVPKARKTAKAAGEAEVPSAPKPRKAAKAKSSDTGSEEATATKPAKSSGRRKAAASSSTSLPE
ncbi:DUF2934 domain-containing protein [Terrihabitans sp. B22-R8]|uniref:DUF2934 domain-containing protein n=1 Tax=Terrihabitans sp. B22-R8 TaxID=3425128 RepID=UPI00403C46B8